MARNPIHRFGHRLSSALRALAFLAAAFAASPSFAQTQSPQGDVPGRFDYYILALSWSPTYCADRRAQERDTAQCGAARRFAFVVHGLWPQREVGWPSDCPTATRDVPPALVQRQLDMMPSERLVEHEWDRHGACTGLSQQAYFDWTRRLRAAIATPPAFVNPDRPLVVTADDVRARFVAANRWLKPNGLAVSCRGNRLQEVRFCFAKTGAPRACGADVRDQCDGRVQMPPVRAAAR